MPELPEVETYRQYLEGTSLNQKIVDIDVVDQRLLKKDLDAFRESLIGREFISTERIGKYLFVKTTGTKVLVMHFGMTGNLEYYQDEVDRPKYAHIVFTFDNGYHLGFLNKRKFGWNDLGDSVESYQKDIGLSNDASKLTLNEFKTSLKKRKTFIKPVIMDQSVAAGIGNWLADEVLYQSQIHPEMKVENMSDGDIERLFNVMREVIDVTIEKEAIYSDFPEDYFIHIRNKGTHCHHTGVEIVQTKVGGRTTYYSPEWQKL